MKYCLFQQQWGQQKRWTFENPPERRNPDVVQNPEMNIEEGLGDLKESVERGMSVEESIDSMDKRRIENSFTWHIQKLNKKYFYPEKVEESQRRRYIKNAQEFEADIRNRTLERIQDTWSKFSYAGGVGENLKTELVNIKTELEESYERFAGRNGLIGPKEVEEIMKVTRIERQISKQSLEENLKMLDGKTEDEVMKILEAMYYFKPKVWEATVPLFPERAFEKAENDANEAALVNLANELDGFNNRIKDYDEAKEYLTEKIIETGKRGPRETIKFMRKMENVLQPHSPGSSAPENAKPGESFEERLEKYSNHSFLWREGYLKGEEPDAEYEKVLVYFMRGDRSSREEILKDPAQRSSLFRAIHITQTEYKKDYERWFKTEKAQKNNKLREKHGSLGGLILLGEEARAIVKNFDQSPEFQGVGLGAKMEKTASQVKGRIPHYKRHKKPKINYGVVSQLEAQGFNARDLALGGVKVAAMATFLVNGVHTINSAEGDGFMAKLGNGMKDIATLKNPTVLLSAAIVAGSRTLQKNKQYFDYFGVGGYEQERMHITRKLNRMADKTKYETVQNYIHDANKTEWRLMADIQEAGGHEKFKQILNEVRQKRREQGYRGPNLLTKEDLHPYMAQGLISQDTYNRMTDSPMKSRVRYEFFQTFLASSNALDVRILKELMIGNGYIDN